MNYSSEFYSTRPYSRAEMTRAALRAGQFAHIPEAEVRAYADAYPHDLAFHDYNSWRGGSWDGIQADSFLRGLAFRFDALCPVCLTPVLKGDERATAPSYHLMPSWLRYSGDDREMEWSGHAHYGLDERQGVIHCQCEEVERLVHRLDHYAEPWVGPKNGYEDFLLLDRFRRGMRFMRGLGREHQQFRAFVDGRAKPPLRFNPRHKQPGDRFFRPVHHVAEEEVVACDPWADEKLRLYAEAVGKALFGKEETA